MACLRLEFGLCGKNVIISYLISIKESIDCKMIEEIRYYHGGGLNPKVRLLIESVINGDA